jgi:hypothetical protein
MASTTKKQIPTKKERYNGFAIAGFVTSFFNAVIGLILSIVGLNQAKKR